MKAIKLTEEMKNDACEEFASKIEGIKEYFKNELERIKMANGQVKYTFNWSCDSLKADDGQVAVIQYSEIAYRKMQRLISEFSTEVEWHGVVSRKSKYLFEIEDILVFPHTAGHATVDTTQEDYEDWWDDLDDEVLNKLRMHGHSHVFMGVNPSGKDDTYQGEFIKNLGKDDFYIFQIWNKRGECWSCLYDMATNTLYENEDIIVEASDPVDDFINEAKDMVVCNSTYSIYDRYDSTKKWR